MRQGLPLNLGLAHSENAKIQPGISKYYSPERMSFSRIRVEIEDLDSAVLIIVIPHLKEKAFRNVSSSERIKAIKYLVGSSSINCC